MTTLIFSTFFGILLSALFSFVINRSDLIIEKFQQIFINREMWEKIFNRMVKQEEIRLGRKSKNAKSSSKDKEQFYQQGEAEEDLEFEETLKRWSEPTDQTIRSLKSILLQKGRLRVIDFPLKLFIREILLSTRFNGMNSLQIRERIISALYIKIMRTELSEKGRIDRILKMNEDVNLGNGLLGLYLLKMGGTEDGVREEIYLSFNKAIKRLTKSSLPKLENIDQQISGQFNIDALFKKIRSQARAQKEFEVNFIKKKQREEQERKRQDDKKRESSKKQASSLNPKLYPDALKIMEITKVVDLAELKKSYKRMAMRHHPDRFSQKDDQERAHEKFIEIQMAFETLSQRTA